MNKWEIVALCIGAYAVAGVGTVIWTATRGEAGKRHFQGIGQVGSAGGIAQAFFLWPVAAYQNLRE